MNPAKVSQYLYRKARSVGEAMSRVIRYYSLGSGLLDMDHCCGY
ncbi:MAG: hypothetical protein JWP81_3572 [Ferruginibacter sp.]|nr:hypothetical protein [Ferruginibacter sp.]